VTSRMSRPTHPMSRVETLSRVATSRPTHPMSRVDLAVATHRLVATSRATRNPWTEPKARIDDKKVLIHEMHKLTKQQIEQIQGTE
jgi:hypothetical protein